MSPIHFAIDALAFALVVGSAGIAAQKHLPAFRRAEQEVSGPRIIDAEFVDITIRPGGTYRPGALADVTVR
jgi:hypothetical protein